MLRLQHAAGCLRKNFSHSVHCRQVGEAVGEAFVSSLSSPFQEDEASGSSPSPPLQEAEEQRQPEEPSAEHEEAACPAAAVQEAEDALDVLQVGAGHTRHARFRLPHDV